MSTLAHNFFIFCPYPTYFRTPPGTRAARCLSTKQRNNYRQLAVAPGPSRLNRGYPQCRGCVRHAACMQSITKQTEKGVVSSEVERRSMWFRKKKTLTYSICIVSCTCQGCTMLVLALGPSMLSMQSESSTVGEVVTPPMCEASKALANLGRVPWMNFFVPSIFFVC